MKLKPILFSTSMVQAILALKKTQTRRVIIPQPDDNGMIHAVTNTGEAVLFDVNSKGLSRYRVGDILWVRETWKYYEKAAGYAETFRIERRIAYKADETRDDVQKSCEWYDGAWKPSIHMPYIAARIFLLVTGVRAERVQDISDADAEAEGVEPMTTPHIPGVGRTYIQGFGELWNAINKKRGYGWDMNPWVDVVTFEPCDKPEESVDD